MMNEMKIFFCLIFSKTYFLNSNEENWHNKHLNKTEIRWQLNLDRENYSKVTFLLCKPCQYRSKKITLEDNKIIQMLYDSK